MRTRTNLVVAVTLAVVIGLGASGAFADIIPIADAAFDNAFQVTSNLSASSDSNDPYGHWWTDTGTYTQQAAGGNPDAWAQRTATSQYARAKALVYPINDQKATKGTATLSFDVHVDSWSNEGKSEIRATVYGIPDVSDWGTGDFQTNGGLNSTLTNMDIPSNAVSLATVDVKDDETLLGGGWESFSLPVTIGTEGYDVLVVYMGIRGVATGDNGGFDNVQLTPEPATMALLGLGGFGLVLRRKRR